MSSDFHVIASIKVLAGQEATARTATAHCAELSRAETGCLSYQPFQDEADPTQFYFVEHWASQAALEAHMQSGHFQAMIQALEPVLAEPLKLVSKMQPVA